MITVARLQKQAKEVINMKFVLKNAKKFNETLYINGYTQRSYGRAIGISESYAHQVATGKRNPGPDVARKTAELLGLEINDIFFIQTACKSDHDEKQVI